MRKRIGLLVLFLAVIIAFGQKDILSTLHDVEQLSTLTEMVQVAGLDDLLSGPGPFTLFAPNDSAFLQLPNKTAEDLSNNLSFMRRVLLFHIVRGSLCSQVIVQNPELETLLGQSLAIDSRGGIRVDGSTMVVRDIQASNGTIHVVDSVIFPREEPDIAQVMRNTGILDVAISAFEETAVVDALKGEGPMTVFVPSDVAFARIPRETMEALLSDMEWLREVLLYHISEGLFATGDLIFENELRSLQGEIIEVKVAESGLCVQNTLISVPDIEARNGIIHVIDHVMFPRNSRRNLPSIKETLEEKGFDLMRSLLETLDLDIQSNEKHRITVFAVPNEALLNLEEYPKLISSDRESLEKLLAFHVIPNEYLHSELRIAQTIFTANGKPLNIRISDQSTVNGIPIIERDILCRDGVIHVIESPLMLER
ncbi:fasciclin domain-containing protein [Mesotoga sp. TolDC]|uniref:fasciclin domain-containing protein n=1 Tax=Mesotoga sp. TolDC TaxID=1389250 RepID=UPI000DA68249|nr:fasciclin domain-containing protein [Mesotoga sp. TolDC]PZC51448.1 beta-Ig-H3/fasciclin [Mesotoga sp. TolDC]